MRRTAQISSSSDLFDLPLVVDPNGREAESSEPPESRPTSEPDALEPPFRAEQIELPEEEGEPAVESESSPLRPRLLAGAIDLGVAAAALASVLAGAAILGTPPRLAHWPAYLFVALEFSLVYAVFSLSFWSATPGMARARLNAQTADGDPISIGQAARRWLGGVITVGLLGLPTLLVLSRRPSLADQLSQSHLET